MDTTLHSARLTLTGMNALDWVVLMLLAISAIAAFMRGLVRSLVALAGMVAAILLGALYAPRLAVVFVRFIKPFAMAQVVAFLAIALVVYLIAALIGRLLRGAVSAVGLGFFDRLAGALFGLVRGVLFLAALLIPAAPLLAHLAVAKTSFTLPYLLQASHGISFVMPREFGQRILPGNGWFHTGLAPDSDAPSSTRSETPTATRSENK